VDTRIAKSDQIAYTDYLSAPEPITVACIIVLGLLDVTGYRRAALAAGAHEFVARMPDS
jgi:hypothetical protein